MNAVVGIIVFLAATLCVVTSALRRRPTRWYRSHMRQLVPGYFVVAIDRWASVRPGISPKQLSNTGLIPRPILPQE